MNPTVDSLPTLSDSPSTICPLQTSEDKEGDDKEKLIAATTAVLNKELSQSEASKKYGVTRQRIARALVTSSWGGKIGVRGRPRLMTDLMMKELKAQVDEAATLNDALDNATLRLKASDMVSAAYKNKEGYMMSKRTYARTKKALRADGIRFVKATPTKKSKIQANTTTTMEPFCQKLGVPDLQDTIAENPTSQHEILKKAAKLANDLRFSAGDRFLQVKDLFLPKRAPLASLNVPNIEISTPEKQRRQLTVKSSPDVYKMAQITTLVTEYKSRDKSKDAPDSMPIMVPGPSSPSTLCGLTSPEKTGSPLIRSPLNEPPKSFENSRLSSCLPLSHPSPSPHLRNQVLCVAVVESQLHLS